VGIDAGSGDDTVSLLEGSTIIGNVELGPGDDTLLVEGDALVTVSAIGATSASGVGIDAGSGDDTVSLLDGSTIIGDVRLGSGPGAAPVSGRRDHLSLVGDALLHGDVTGSDFRLSLIGAGRYDGVLSGLGELHKSGPGAYRVSQLGAAPRLLSIGEGTVETGADFTFNDEGEYWVTVNAAGTPVGLRADGAATLAGDLLVERSRGYFADGMQFDLVRGAAVSGSFADEQLPEPTRLLRFETYTEDDAFWLRSSSASFGSVADNKVEAAVASYMDWIAPTATGDLADVLGEFQLLSSNAEFDQAFASLSPTPYDELSLQTVAATRENERAVHRRIIDQRMVSAPYWDEPGEDEELPDVAAPPFPRESPWGAWAGALGRWSDWGSHNGYVGLDARTGGVVFGVDRMVEERWLAGASLGLAHTDVDLNRGLGDGEVDSTFLSLYGSWFEGDAYLEGVLGYGRNRTDSVRQLRIGQDLRTAEVDYYSDSWLAFGQLGYRFALQRSVVEPFFALSYVRLNEDGIHERGAGGVSLDIGSRNTDSLQSELGARLYSRFALTRGLFVPEFLVAWGHDFDIDDRTLVSAYRGAGATFPLDGRSVPRNGLIVGADLRFENRNGVSASLNLRSETWERVSALSALLEIGVEF
jgi:outer membrane autotransporter protein